jgi:hypothetical protein
VDQEGTAETQLAAFAELFALMSSMTGDTEEVLAEITRRAVSLCDATYGIVYLLDGDVIRYAAGSGGNPEHLAYERATANLIDRHTLAGRVALERAIVHIPDVLDDAEYQWDGQHIAGYRTMPACR